MKVLAVLALVLALSGPAQMPHNRGNIGKTTQPESTSNANPVQKPALIPKEVPAQQPQGKTDNGYHTDRQEAPSIIVVNHSAKRDWVDYLGLLISFVLIVITGTGVIAAWRSLPEILRQAKATEDAAIVAGNSLELSRDTAKRQLRAYMMADLVSIGNIADPAPMVGPLIPTDARITHPEWGPVAEIVIRNTGQTPAHDVDHWGSIVYRENPLTSDLLSRPSDVKKSFLTVVGPKIGISKRLNIPARLNPDEISGLMSGTGAIYLHGIINYRDVFNERHTTHYRLMYTNGMSKVGISTDMTFAQEGNEAD